jgi:hypothetical protein
MSVTKTPAKKGFPHGIEQFLTGNRKWGLGRFAFLLGMLTVLYGIGLWLGPGRWRLVLAPLAGVTLPILGGALYLREIYELESFWLALRYVISAFFGFFNPQLRVHGGRKVLKPEQTNLLEAVGGPGFVSVTPGNAVLFEGLRGPTAIHPSGWSFVPAFERVDAIALEDQSGEIEELSVTTRDGIEVKVKNARFRYRLSADLIRRTRNNPYPYAESAIFDMLYNRTVSEDGLSDWHSGIVKIIQGVIAQYISHHTLDHLTAPSDSGVDPRAEIKAKINSAQTAARLRERGAELLWFDVGIFDIPNKQVEKQRLSAWQARWIGDARLARSYGEAQRSAYQEIGRAEAQAELLISIMNALKEIDLNSGSRQNLRDLILLRTAQLLEMAGRSANPNQPGSAQDLAGSKKDV